jgi:hypothetical protein
VYDTLGGGCTVMNLVLISSATPASFFLLDSDHRNVYWLKRVLSMSLSCSVV